ncbi:MAG TPA: hypothetical protein EYP36_11205 [Calditrichaeota bacterium]|nr:hypothetical protein [Calditrichota bacterium]
MLFSRGRGTAGRGQGSGRGQGAGPQGRCVCPSCGEKIKHEPGKPCNTVKCPKCHTPMVRE